MVASPEHSVICRKYRVVFSGKTILMAVISALKGHPPPLPLMTVFGLNYLALPLFNCILTKLMHHISPGRQLYE